MARDRRTPTLDAKIAGSRLAQLKSPDCGPTAMSLPDRRFAADGAAYTYTDFVQWYGAHAGQMWEAAGATEHSRSRTPQSSDGLAARRIAADGTAYTYTDFVDWFGTNAGQLWERAAATEHSGSSSIATHALPAFISSKRDCNSVEGGTGGTRPTMKVLEIATEHVITKSHIK